jgi:Baseplate J-like protein
MPSPKSTPDIGAYLRAYAAGIRAEQGPTVSARRGGALDLFGGSAALLWSRQSARDRDLFRGTFYTTAAGADLDRLALRYFGVERIHDTTGTGTLVLYRPAGGLEGELYAGTRVAVVGPEGVPREVYAVAKDHPVGALETLVEVPIRATRPGPGVAVKAAGSQVRIQDIIFDGSFAPVSLVCADGTAEEGAEQLIARGRVERRNGRLGYRASIVDTCKGAGAEHVVALEARTFVGEDEDDLGESYVYVADASFTSSPALLDACAVALEQVRVAGADLLVLGMVPMPVMLAITAQLVADPQDFDVVDLRTSITARVLDVFAARPQWWEFSTEALAGEVERAAPRAVLVADVDATPAPPEPGFPAALPRFTLAAKDIAVKFVGPNG